tara:strand:+ start:400 stop:519 length:120 start_codon:yes stop_codon:yes gene_type:complete
MSEDKKENEEEVTDHYDHIFYKNADIVIAFRKPKVDEEE